MQKPSFIDPRTQEDLLRELRGLAVSQGFSPRDGGLLDTLLSLYSHMLDDTVRRLNCVPEKHRIAFLNLCQVSRLPAHAAETVVVFRPVEGCGQTVLVPEGTLVVAQGNDGPVAFRTKHTFGALPVALGNVCWCDAEKDQLVTVAVKEGVTGSFTAWSGAPPERGRHFVDFILQNVFCAAGEQAAVLTVTMELNGQPVQANILTDTSRFLWSLYSFPETEETPAICCSGTAVPSDTEDIVFKTTGFSHSGQYVRLRLELLDPSLTELDFLNFHLRAQKEEIPAEAVMKGDREFLPDSFYPFQCPMRAFEECFLFCGEALSRQGAELTVSFDLSLEVTQEFPPKLPKQIDYKWIMRRQEPPLDPPVLEAFAREIRWEYWNGTAFRELPLNEGIVEAFTKERAGMCLRFDCPADLTRGTCGEREGYFLRLSCGACDELYQLPRRIYTPRLTHLRFSFCYREPIRPRKILNENFGMRRTLAFSGVFRPFSRPPRNQALFLRLEGELSGGCLQIFFDLGDRCTLTSETVTAELFGSGGVLPAEDETGGFSHSGMVTVTFPSKVPPAELGGKKGRWLCFSPPARVEGIQINGIYLNAQLTENRMRRREQFSLSSLTLDGKVKLAYGNIVKLWVFVFDPGTEKWSLWNETTRLEKLNEGCYLADHREGGLEFPQQIFAHVTGSPATGDVLSVVYDTTDGTKANVPSGSICQMWEEVPLIAEVWNPMQVHDGWDSETDGQLALRTEHLLYHGGRAVSPKDYELLAKDACPLVFDARCIPGHPVRLVILTGQEIQKTAFQKLKNFLMLALEESEDRLEILPAVPVPLCCCIALQAGLLPVPQLEEWLADFLDPLTGGLYHKGWQVGVLPDYEQIQAFLLAKAPQMDLLEITVTACGGGLSGDWRTISPNPWHVPGKPKIEWGESWNDEFANA